jgi:hypothetical protein
MLLKGGLAFAVTIALRLLTRFGSELLLKALRGLQFLILAGLDLL